MWTHCKPRLGWCPPVKCWLFFCKSNHIGIRYMRMCIYIYIYSVHIYIIIVNFNMFHGPCHSKASGPDTYNIYSCLQHLAEASLRDWWVGSACGTPFVPLSRGRLISRAVDSIFAFERRLGHFIPRSAGKRERGRSSEDCISCCGYLSEPHSDW